MSEPSELSLSWLFVAAVALGPLGCAIDDRTPDTASASFGMPGPFVASAGAGVEGRAAPPVLNGASGAPGSGTMGSATMGDGMTGSSGAGTTGTSGTAGMSPNVPGEAPPGEVPLGSAGAGSGGAGGNVPASSVPGSNVGAAGTGSAVNTGPAPCRGCVELVVPVTGPDQAASFRFLFDQPTDFSQASLTWRVQVLEPDTNTNFYLTTDVQIITGPGIFENYTVLSPYNFSPGEWLDLSVDVSAHPPRMVEPGAAVGFDYRAVQLVVLTLGTTPTFASTDTIRVLVDSLTVSGVPSFTSRDFSTGTQGLGLAAGAPPGTSEPIFHP